MAAAVRNSIVIVVIAIVVVVVFAGSGETVQFLTIEVLSAAGK
jgi:hypothetical protein